MILATVENMRKYRREPHTVEQPGGSVITIYPVHPIAFSYETGECCSADPGDYFFLPDGLALTDSTGDPMYLVVERHIIVDVDDID